MKRHSALLLISTTVLASTATSANAANQNTPAIDKVLTELNRQHSNASNLAKAGRSNSSSLALNSGLLSSTHTSSNNSNMMDRLTEVASTTVNKFSQSGSASWTGKKMQGQTTASGEKFNMYAMTASHPYLPMNSYVEVTNKATGKSVVVKINDRRPSNSNRILDLSYGAAKKLGVINNSNKVTIKRIFL